MRVGIGYDIHRLVRGRRLILSGVEVPFYKGLEGHSDADVVLHAISDAMLGALALGDIGMHFPDDDPAYKNASSKGLLGKVYDLIHEKGYLVNNVDTVIVIEKPRISPFFSEMRANVSRILQTDISHISIKAATNEHVGTIGSGEAVASYAVVTLSKH